MQRPSTSWSSALKYWRDKRGVTSSACQAAGFTEISCRYTRHARRVATKTALILAHLTVHAHGVTKKQPPLRRDRDKLYGQGVYV